jgi:ADP-ribose pyrophosphatase YjhB (NUDIX family)
MISLIARAIIPLNGKFLLVRNKGADYWCLPGGNVDPQEPIPQALERELVEELGVRPAVGQLLYVQQLSRESGEERVEFFFLVNNPEEYETVDITKTTHGAAELDAADFRDLDENVYPEFLTEELPALLKSRTDGILPHFRMNRL